MATTTNYGWTTPDDTALVKDGAAAIRTLGSSVDTTTKNLNPGTTAGDLAYYTSSTAKARIAIGSSGQALTVVAGVPSWAASATSVLTAKGDLLTATGANIIARLGVGSNGQILKADSTTATGLAWGAAAAYPEIASNFVATAETSAASSYSGLTTAQSVTLTTGTKVLVIVTAEMRTTSSGTSPQMSYAISGATTSAASDAYAIRFINPGFTDPADRMSAVSFRTVTAGSNTFTAQFKRDASTATFLNREITVINLGS